jgi:phage terminase large subunit
MTRAKRTERTIKLPAWLSPWAKPSRYKIAHGGRGSGKSWGIARLLLIRAMERKTRILCAREYQASIADSVHRLLSDQIRELELPGFSVTRTGIEHANGSSFIFRGLARNPHSVKSMEGVDVVWVEEAHAVSDESWRYLIPTIRADGSEIWVSFNPRYLDDPTTARFYLDNAPPGAVVSEVNHDKNPWFPPVLADEMALDYSRDPDRAAHVWGGKPLTNSNAQVLYNKWEVREFKPGADWDGPYFGVDWGMTDPTAGVRVWLHRDVVYVEHEAYARGCDDPAALLIRDLPGILTHTSRADNSWPETIAHVRRKIPRIQPVLKWGGSVDDGIAWLRGRARIVIHPRCKNTAAEAGLWRYKTDAAENVLPKLQPGDDHAWDAVRYALEQHIRKRSVSVSNG